MTHRIKLRQRRGFVAQSFSVRKQTPFVRGGVFADAPHMRQGVRESSVAERLAVMSTCDARTVVNHRARPQRAALFALGAGFGSVVG